MVATSPAESTRTLFSESSLRSAVLTKRCSEPYALMVLRPVNASVNDA